MDETDLIGWNSPSITSFKSLHMLDQPLLPAINLTDDINNPFDEMLDAVSQIQNPFDDVCSLAAQQQHRSCNTTSQQEDFNLLNDGSIKMNWNESLNLQSDNNTDDVLKLSYLNDQLLDDEMFDEVEQDEDMEVAKFLSFDENLRSSRQETGLKKRQSRSACQFETQARSDHDELLNISLGAMRYRTLNSSANVTDVFANDTSSCETDVCYDELCSKLESSFNKSKHLFEQIRYADEKIIATFKRRSADFCNRKEEQDSMEHIQKEISDLPLNKLQSKTALFKPFESSQLKAHVTKSQPRSRPGPMKAVVPLQNMIKPSKLSVQEKSNARKDKPGVEPPKVKKSSVFKSSYHRSPPKQLVLRSKSSSNTPNKVPPLASSTPEKCISRQNSFSSSSPLKAATQVNSSGKQRSSSLSRLKQPNVFVQKKFNFLSDDKENISLNSLAL